MKSAMQAVIPDSLHGQVFFGRAAFCGHAAAPVAYGSPLFSEYLDFSLPEPDAHVDLMPLLDNLKRAYAAFGQDIEVSGKSVSWREVRYLRYPWSPRLCADMVIRGQRQMRKCLKSGILPDNRLLPC